MNDRESIEIKLPSVMDFLAMVNSVAEEVAARIGLPEPDRDTICTSVVEVCTNAIEHGNREDPSKYMNLRIDYDSSRIDIYVSDEGTGFDPDSLRDPVKPENLLRERGRGIFILRAFMDEVNFNMAPGSGTTVHLVKNLNQNAKAAPG